VFRYRFAGALQPTAVTVPGELGHQGRAVNDTESHMATQDTYSRRVHLPAEGPTRTATESGHTVLERRRGRSAERKRARVVSARNRRVLAQWLRRTANRTPRPRPVTLTPEPLLHYRAAAVRTELLEIAALLERAHDPDPACVAELRRLLANGCDSPLYNSDIHVSELHATLHHVRARLVA
jgi:hypothetical protein